MANISSSYSAISRKLAFSSIFGNSVAGFLCYIYFSVIDPIPQGEASVNEFDTGGLLIFIMYFVALTLVTSFSQFNIVAPIKKWHFLLEAGTPHSEIPVKVYRKVLNYPFSMVLVTSLAWITSGIFFGSIYESARIGLGIIGVGGILMTFTVYLSTEFIWKAELKHFFPNGHLNAIKAIRFPILHRLLIVFFLIGLYPTAILVSLSLSRAKILVNADNPNVILNNLFILEMFIVGVVAMICIGMSFFLTRSIVSPLHAMKEGMERVRQNDFSVKIPVTSNDELGQITENFNAMVHGLQQGEMLRSLFGLYVTPEVAHAALEQGAQLGGKLSECTVLFSDIRDFTTLSENLDPIQLIELLNRYLNKMVGVITANQGMVNKFGGDSILAVFGTPLNPSENHAALALKTAYEMKQGLAEFNEAQAHHQAPQLQFGIGIATGPVVAGNVGGQERIEYTVIGDTVNLASRLESKTKELDHKILLSAASFEAAQPNLAMKVQHLPDIFVKGKREPISVYALLD